MLRRMRCWGRAIGIDVLTGWSQNPAADLERATEMAQKALTLDDSNGMALSQLCEIYWMQRQFRSVGGRGSGALPSTPGSPSVIKAQADAMSSRRPEEALKAIEKAIRLDPGAGDFYAYFIGAAYVQMGRYEEAVSFLKRNAAAFPNEPWVHENLLVAYIELGRNEEARAEAAAILRIDPHFLLVPPERGTTKDVAFNRLVNDDMRKAGLK